MSKTFEDKLFKAMQVCWIESQSWEQGFEGPAAKDRGSFKHGFLTGGDWGYREGIMAAIDMLRSSYPKDNDGPYRCGAWFGDWLEEQFKNAKL